MKYLIIGLGNPGAEYELTRHNIGFIVLDQLAERYEAEFRTERLAEKTEIKHKGRTLHLVKPNTYMNASGKAVNYWMQELKIDRSQILVVVDEIALAQGQLRMRAKGSDGGHNGLKDIQHVLQGNNYPRLRFGIGNDYHKGKQIDYVLGNFTQEQLVELEAPLEKACEMILAFATIGIERAMTQYNE